MEDNMMENNVQELIGQILESIEAGVIVLSGEDRRVLYENEIIKEFDKVREAIINSCEDELIYEFCDEEFELWYEVRDIKVPWVNGEQSDVYTVVDITNSKLQKKRAQYQENSDFLTGLYNRNRCEKDLQNEIDKAVESGQKGAILFMDLDDFKHINEGLGHQYGDVLLQAIAEGLRNIRNADGRCYRIGGDEFVILVPCEKYGDIEDIISDIKALFNEPWDLMGAQHFCSVSTGVAVYPDNSIDMHDIIKMAGLAMYDARQSGKNQVSYYKGSSNHNFKKNYDIENNMRHAIATEIDEFVVFYQPVVDTFTKECTSCEALVRWNSKALGFMGPGEFIPLAEYLGLITEIGDFVLEEACKQCRKWNDEVAPNLCVHINLSVLQLLQKNAVENVRSIMERTGVNPKNIVLEITESFAINDMERVLNIVAGLKELGAGIALDDFGTGYSSLNYIKQLPLNIIKVDKTFIDDIVEDEYAQAFIKLIVELSKTIGTKIVVEGVEWQQQYDVLKSLGVNYIQGFLFGKPVNPGEFERMHLRKGD
ncbi:MAG: EAL domain-containing protein [Lachnospira sp.]|nr:EAL domain-containing protein [Lachnospira sp.]